MNFWIFNNGRGLFSVWQYNSLLVKIKTDKQRKVIWVDLNWRKVVD